MRFLHPEHPGRALRLATCMNLWPVAEAGDGGAAEPIIAGLSEISLPLRDRLAAGDASFGVGLWLPAATAADLARCPDERARLIDFLVDERLDAFTFNAFPFGGFHEPGLKRRVFEPTWTQPDRAAYTLAVASFGLELAREARWEPGRHLSISTHTGGHREALVGSDGQPMGDLGSFRRSCAANLVETNHAIAGLEPGVGIPVVLGIEPEPRSLAGDTRELGELWDALDAAEDLAGDAPAGARSVGVCLDACHAAVEFEEPEEARHRALGLSRERARSLSKLQYSSALRLDLRGGYPAASAAGFDALVAMDEPVYLHQTTGRTTDGELLRAADLGEVAADRAKWLACSELRCHFHVPVDLASRGALGTTRDHADALLARVLAEPETWGTAELHVEIETYTWALEAADVDRVAGIEAEYRHVIGRLAALGWEPA